MASYQPESSVDVGKTKKFQDLNVSDTFKVNGFKPIITKFGKTYILLVKHIVSDMYMEIFAPKMITDYIDSGKIHQGGFTFQVKSDRNSKYKYAVILF